MIIGPPTNAIAFIIYSLVYDSLQVRRQSSTLCRPLGTYRYSDAFSWFSQFSRLDVRLGGRMGSAEDFGSGREDEE